MKIDSKVESIFSQALAFEQNSRSKNIIGGKGKDIYIMNSNSTIMMRFDSGCSFPAPFCFHANDYESNNFQQKDDTIIFISQNKNYEKKKGCKAPDMTVDKMIEIYESLFPEQFSNKISVTSDILDFIDRSLSHVEISISEGDYKIMQRDIFSGSVSTVTKKQAGLLSSGEDEVEHVDLTVGLKTGDFAGLFLFGSQINFYLFGNGYCYFQDSSKKFDGFIATCLYDDLGKINYLMGA